ncbi:regulator of chromosome condensation (RCC1) [Thraustotheca clavata]|uniref:Regulator of chromosome condensation (RCC1) n=1 Tax=Thraustotheca clavata TaxID=74557 RepID=A0A1V9ZD05_9STRA|nr:regulator of chromosome condensation (RCC1) [Thraustotheca clavata]
MKETRQYEPEHDKGSQVTVQLSTRSLLVVEGGASCFYSTHFKGKYKPKHPVVITPWTTSSKIKIYPSMLLFQPDNAHKPQFFRVTALENNAPDGAEQIIEHKANSIDPSFSGSGVNFEPKSILVCTTRNDGKYAFSAGDSQCGELGQGPNTFSYTFKEIPLIHFIESSDYKVSNVKSMQKNLLSKVASGTHHTHIVDGNGQIFSFGNSEHGQLGPSSWFCQSLREMKATNKPVPVTNFNSTNCFQVIINGLACGGEHSIAFSQDDDVFTWGNNDFFQLGTHQGESTIPRTLLLPMRCKVAQLTTKVACGAMHSVLLMAEGVVLTWGYGKSGALGHGPNRTNITSPTRVESLASVNIFHVSCGDMHTAVVSGSGDLYTAGWCEYGRLGRNVSNDCSPMFEKARYSTYYYVDLKQRKCTYVACGGAHTMLLTDDHKVFAFGANQYGQLGVGDCRDKLLPTQIIFFQGISICNIQLGQNHSLAITDDNVLYAWGNGEQGQCGVGDYPQIYTLPSLVKSLIGCKVVQVAAGSAFSIALTMFTPEYVQFQHQENKELAKHAKSFILEDINRRERVRHIIRSKQLNREGRHQFDCKLLLNRQRNYRGNSVNDSKKVPPPQNSLLATTSHTTSLQRALRSAVATQRPRSSIPCCMGRTIGTSSTQKSVQSTLPKAKASWIITKQSALHRCPTNNLLRPNTPPPPYPR